MGLNGSAGALVVIYLDPSVFSDSFEKVNRFTFFYESKKQCENFIIKHQEEHGGTITRDSDNHIFSIGTTQVQHLF